MSSSKSSILKESGRSPDYLECDDVVLGLMPFMLHALENAFQEGFVPIKFSLANVFI